MNSQCWLGPRGRLYHGVFFSKETKTKVEQWRLREAKRLEADGDSEMMDEYRAAMADRSRKTWCPIFFGPSDPRLYQWYSINICGETHEMMAIKVSVANRHNTVL